MVGKTGCDLLLRYGLEPDADELPVKDFKSMLGFRLGVEIDTGPLPVHAKGSNW